MLEEELAKLRQESNDVNNKLAPKKIRLEETKQAYKMFEAEQTDKIHKLDNVIKGIEAEYQNITSLGNDCDITTYKYMLRDKQNLTEKLSTAQDKLRKSQGVIEDLNERIQNLRQEASTQEGATRNLKDNLKYLEKKEVLRSKVKELTAFKQSLTKEFNSKIGRSQSRSSGGGSCGIVDEFDVKTGYIYAQRVLVQVEEGQINVSGINDKAAALYGRLMEKESIAKKKKEFLSRPEYANAMRDYEKVGDVS